MKTAPPEDILEALAELSPHDVDEFRAERIRARAHAVLERRRHHGVTPWTARLQTAYRAGAAGLGLSYLAITVYWVAELLR